MATLEEAVKLMASHQLGKDLKDEELSSVVTFLSALTGDLPPDELTNEPSLPVSTAKTPKADPN